MAYWLDDGFDTWPEVVRAGKAATGLYVCCGAWIARSIGNGTLTEPVIPAEIATMYGTPEWVAKLVDVGLWRTEGAGFRDVKYLAMGNPTAEQVQKRRKADADRKARWRENRDRSRRDTTRDSHVSHSVQPRVTPHSPALPPLKGEGGASARAAPPNQRCPDCGNTLTSSYHRRVCEPSQETPWPPPDDPETATPPTAHTSSAPPATAASAPANDSHPNPSPLTPSPPPSAQDPPSPPAVNASPPPSTENPTPAAGDLVWIATRRRGIEAHQLDTSDGRVPAFTTCGRSVRTGEQLTADDANTRYQATWCPRCWPTPQETAA